MGKKRKEKSKVGKKMKKCKKKRMKKHCGLLL
jgi:hypothetical protein